MTPPTRLVLALSVSLSLFGCTSATKRYEQGQELEREGRPIDAANRYIQALQKDGRLDSARAGLRTAGVAAITQYLGAESQLDLTTVAGVDQSADNYISIDDLRTRALQVGVDLPVPPDYSVRRRTALDRAIGLNLSDAQNLTSRGQFDVALDRLERASDRYQPAPMQQGELADARGDAMVAWGRADLAAGAYRAAYNHVQPTFNTVGANQPQAEAARQIQAEALRRGTRRVVVLAPRATPEAVRSLPPDFLGALSDAMRSEPWTKPPLFVDLVPLADVERALRGPNPSDRWMPPEEGALLGRALRSDFVIIAHIDSVRHDQLSTRSTRRAAKTTRGVDTAYVMDEGQRRTTLFGEYTIIDVSSRQRAEQEPFSAMTTGNYTRPRFAGDYKSLELSKAEQQQFERSTGSDIDRDVAGALVGELSRQLATSVFNEVLRRIP